MAKSKALLNSIILSSASFINKKNAMGLNNTLERILKDIIFYISEMTLWSVGSKHGRQQRTERCGTPSTF